MNKINIGGFYNVHRKHCNRHSISITCILLGSEQYPQYDYMEVTVIDTERYLPKLLVNHGFISSVSECKRNRKDLILTLDKTDCIEVEFKKAKKKVFIVIGE